MESDFNRSNEYAAGLGRTDSQDERFLRIINELENIDDKTVIRRLKTEMSLDWRDVYNTGIEEIDAQHRKFLQLIQEMYEIQCAPSHSADTERLLDELLDYADLHFRSEELLMQRFKYPKLDQQKKEHEILTAELRKQVSALRESK